MAFIDTSLWFAAAVARDRDSARAKAILEAIDQPVTTDHVIVETWLLLNSRYHRRGAERYWEGFRHGGVRAARVTPSRSMTAKLVLSTTEGPL